MSDGVNITVSPVIVQVEATSNVTVPPATTGSLGGIVLDGDLGGTASSPEVLEIQGTAIAAPPGGTTKFLRGDGTWQVPASSGGGITPPAGDIGGTTLAPTVVSTHLSAPLPIAQGGTASTTAAGALTNLGALPTAGGTMSGAIAMGANKITGVANGTVSTDVAAFGQIPASLPPNGAAGGDLTGTYPNPTVTATANFKTQVETVRLDQLAAPTAAVSMNSQKITSLANGTVSTDAAAFGQIPTALPPNGSAGGDLGSTYPNPTVTATHLASPLPLAQGGTAAATQQGAINSLTGTQTAGRYLRSDGTNATLAAIQAGDVPTLNQSTTGTAAGLSTTLAIGSGGTGQTTQQAAINALTGSQTSGRYLRSDGTNATLAAIQAGDVPTLNQSTTGTAAGLSATLAIGSGGTGQTSAAAAYNALSPMTTLGDLEYESGTNTASRLAGNTSATKNFLTQTGNGSVSAAPVWGTIAVGDVPTLNQSTTGTASNVTGTVAVANGGTGGTTATAGRAGLGVYNWDTPSGRGFLEYNFPPQLATISNNFVSGSIYGVSIIAQAASAITKVGVGVLSSAATPTSGQNVIAIYSISGTTATQMTITGDLTTWGSQGFNSFSFGAGQTLTAGATYLILLMSNATTPVHLGGLSTTAGFPPMYNAGLSNTASPWFKVFLNGTAQTALPASFTISGTTMASTNAQFPWVCLL